MMDKRGGIKIYISDPTYGRGNIDWEKESTEFKRQLEAEFHLQFEVTSIGTGAAEPAFVTVLVEFAKYVTGGVIALFLLGETIEKNLDVWPRLYKRLTEFLRHRPTFEIDGAAVLAVEAISSAIGTTPRTVQLLGYRYESVLVRPLEEIVREEVEPSSIAQPPERARSATVHVFKIQAEGRIFKVLVCRSEVTAIELH
jgi:hypothetical protein